MSGGIGSNDGVVNLKGRIEGGQLVALYDHAGNELGTPVTTKKNTLTGVKRFSGMNQKSAQRTLRIGTFGDSTANFSSLGGTNLAFDQEYLTITAGYSAQTLLTGFGNKIFVNRLYPSARVVCNGGISGETTAQMIARDGNVSSATRNAINDVLSKNLDAIIFRGASINDILGLNLTDYISQANVNAICTRHMRLALALRAGGPVVIDEGCAGFDGAGGNIPANVAFVKDAVVRLNQAINSAHAKLSDPGLIYLDPVGITCQPDGGFISGATGVQDRTHLSCAGQYWLAQREAGVLEQVFGVSLSRTFGGKNLLDTLAYWSVGGALPTGYVPAAGNCVLQGAVIELDSKGEVCWKANVNSVATGAYVTFAVPFNIYAGAPSPAITITSGDIVTFELDYEVRTRDGSNILPDFTPVGRLNLQNSSGGRMLIDHGPGTYYGDTADYGTSVLSGHIALAGKINDVTANLTSSCLTRANIYLPVLAAGYEIRFKNPFIGKL